MQLSLQLRARARESCNARAFFLQNYSFNRTCMSVYVSQMMYSFLFLDLTSILCLVAQVCKSMHRNQFFVLAAVQQSVDWWRHRSGTALPARC